MLIRKTFKDISKNLNNNNILLLTGARQVGKTTLLKQLQFSLDKDAFSFFLNLEDPDIKTLLNTHPNKLFEITGSRPEQTQYIFIDEIQYLDNPTNFLKYIYDEYKGTIKLIVSGSSSFYIDQKFKDSLIGRKKVFHISTLDFEEFLEFQGKTQLQQVIREKRTPPLLLKQEMESSFLEYITYGGYPEIVLITDIEEKKERLAEFTLDYIKKDIYDSNIADQDKFLAILRALAAQTGELVNLSEIANTFNLSVPTVEKYIYIMQKSFHIQLVRPYYTNIRKELSKMPKVYFHDIGFRNSLLKNFEPISLRTDKGAVLENICFREFLFLYGGENIQFWRTQSKNEVDFIINRNLAYEIKYSPKLIKTSKYKSFQKQYPEIPLEFITFENIFEMIYQSSSVKK